MRHVYLLVVLLNIMTSGCVYPVKVSSECNAKINACLESCESQEPVENSAAEEGKILTDHRNRCEQSCHTMCH